jgi:hypothetical protein
MEFAEWIVAGLDQLRLGQLPAGNGLYEAASAGLGGDPRLPGYMNSGDPAARAELVQLIAAAVAANPGFEQQLRYAAAAAQNTAPAKPPFLKTTNGLLVIVVAALVVVGGGIGLALGLSGGSGDLAGLLKGSWTCQAVGIDTGGARLGFTVGDGTWSAGAASGTWTQSGSTAALHDPNDSSNNVKATGLPSGAGSFDIAVGSTDPSQLLTVRVKGTVGAHKLTLELPSGGGGIMNLTCTK